MKFTVKNCPDSEWKKGFEKELREKAKRDLPSTVESRLDVLKEILG